MKRNKWLILILCLTIAFTATVLFACGNDDAQENTTDDPGENIVDPEETVRIRTVEIVNGNSHSLKSYSYGAVIKLKADLSADSVFVCWTSQGVPFSYENETYYTVQSDAVVKAVYAERGSVTLDPDGGALPKNSAYAVYVYKTETVQTTDALFTGFSFALPVPTRTPAAEADPEAGYDVTARYDFDGWFDGETRVTDASGKSVAVYAGGSAHYVAKYKEKPYAYLTLIRDGTDEVLFTEKVYLENFRGHVFKAPEIADCECVGICTYADGERIQVTGKNDYGSADTYSLESIREAKAGATYVFGAMYREAYRLTVLDGVGTGYYEKAETISIENTALTGADFRGWLIKMNKKRYYLAQTGTGATCLLSKDGTEAVYWDETEGKAVSVSGTGEGFAAWLAENGIELMGGRADVVLSDLERLGVEISGKNTVIEGEFRRKEFALTYVISCQVDGQHCLDEAAETQLRASGFTYYVSDDSYRRTQYYNYNEDVDLLSVPTVAHYKFGNWQNADPSENVPSRMPNYDVIVLGLFTPDTHQITVSVKDGLRGNVHIGALGDVKRAYYNYGSTIEFYLTAYSGYKLSRWVDVDGREISVNELTEEKDVDVTYVFSRTITGDETLVVELVPRNYTITYVLSVEYDGADVTRDPSFFEENGYVDGYWQFSEERDFGTVGTFRPKTAVKGTATPDGLPLLFGAQNWSVSEWKVYGAGVASDENGVFSMPDRDLTVTSTCRINSYTVVVSRRDGVDGFTVNTVNGRSAEGYRDGQNERFIVPYASRFGVSVRYGLGYSLGTISAAGVALHEGEASEYTHVGDASDKYAFSVGFRLINGADTTYVIGARQLNYNLTYYVSYDYLHEDADVLLTNYITFDPASSVEYDGKTYYRVTGLKNNQDTFVDINSAEKTYGSAIPNVFVNSAAYKYAFGGWTKMKGDEQYDSSTMPDDDVWIFGSFTLNRYTFKMGKTVYRYDGAAGTAINSANVVSMREHGETTNYAEGEYEEEGRHAYYTAFTLERHIPTGYDFVTWQIFEETNQTTPVAEFIYDQSLTEVQTVVAANSKVFKYAIGEDGQVVVYLTEDSVVMAKYSVQHFTATALIPVGTVSLKTPEADEYSWIATTLVFDYLSNLMLSYNGETYLQRGQKVTGFRFMDENGDPILDGNGDPVVLDTAFHQDTLVYGNGGYYITTASTTVAFTQNVFVEPVLEDVTYYLTYRVYSHAKNVRELDADDYTDITEDENGDPLTVPFKQNCTLLQDVAFKTLAGQNGVYVTDVMHSGWYNAKSLTTSATEASGYAGAGGVYQGTFTYNHTVFSEHAQVCCYLVDLYEFTEGYLRVNPVISGTTLYKQHFAATYRELTLPATGGSGAAVVAVETSGFEGFTSLESVTLPASITTIGSRAFYNCTSLVNTGLNDTVVTIGEEAYKNCSSLEDVYIGNAVKTIGHRAFEYCTALTSVLYDDPAVKGNNGLTVGQNVFRYAGSGGYTFVIGANTSLVPSEFFDSELDVHTGENLAAVQFEEEEGAEDVVIEGSAFYGSGLARFLSSARLTSLGTSAFRECKSLTAVDLTATGLTSLGDSTFQGSGLTEAILPDAITTLGAYVFMDCTSLVSVYYEQDGPRSIGVGAFKRANTGNYLVLRRITVLANKAAVDADATAYKEIRLENLTVVGDNAFEGCPQVAEVILGGASTVLGDTLFADATGLQRVEYAVIDGADKLDNTHMSFAATLASDVELVIAEGVTDIPDYMFYGFGVVSTLKIPSTVEYIGSSAFGNMSAITSVEYAAEGLDLTVGTTPFTGVGVQAGYTLLVKPTVVELCDTLFFASPRLTTVTVEAGDETAQQQTLVVGSRTFASTGVKTVVFPKRAALSFGENAFRDAPLETVTIHNATERVTFLPTSFSQKGSPASGHTFTMNAFGKSMGTLIGALSTGTFVVENTVGGLVATLTGTMRTTSGLDATIEAGETLLVNGANGKFIVTDRATVYGTLTVGGGSAETTNTTQYFRAVAGSAADFYVKNACSYYTHLRTATELVFNEDVTVNVANLEIYADLTVNADVIVNSTTVTTDANVAVTTATHAFLKIAANGINGTTLTAQPDAAIVIGGRRYFYDTEVTQSDLSAASAYGFRVKTGTAQLIGGLTSVSYSVGNGSVITTQYEYEETSPVLLAAGATLETTSSANVELATYTVAFGATVLVKDSSRVLMSQYAANFHGTVDAEAHVTGGATRVYYATLYGVVTTLSAIATELSVAVPTVLLDKNITTSIAYTSNSSYELNFNGKSMTLTSGLFAYAGNLTLVNPDLTVTGSSEAVKGNGDLTITGGTVTSAATAIKTYAGLVTVTNATVTSSGDVAIRAAAIAANGATVSSSTEAALVGNNVSVSGGHITGETGILTVNDNPQITLSNGAEITGSTAYGVWTDGMQAIVSVAGATEISGVLMGMYVGGESARVTLTGSVVTASAASGVGLYMEQGKYTTRDDTAANLTVDENTEITGVKAGAILRGSGYYAVNGTLTATAAREIALNDDDKLTYTGALVVIEGNSTEEDFDTWSGAYFMQVLFGGTATNATGDALVYSGVRGDFSTPSGINALTVTNAGVVNGGVVEYLDAYRIAGSGETAFVGMDNDTLVYDGAHGDYVFKDNLNTVLASRPNLLDSPIGSALIAGTTFRKFERFAALSDAVSASGSGKFVWVNNASSLDGGTLTGAVILRDVLTLTGSVTMSSGTLSILQGGRLNVGSTTDGTFTIGGTATIDAPGTRAGDETLRVTTHGTYVCDVGLKVEYGTVWNVYGAMRITKKINIQGEVLCDGATLYENRWLFTSDSAEEGKTTFGKLTFTNDVTIVKESSASAMPYISTREFHVIGSDTTFPGNIMVDTQKMYVHNSELTLRSMWVRDTLYTSTSAVFMHLSGNFDVRRAALYGAQTETDGFYGSLICDAAQTHEVKFYDQFLLYGRVEISDGSSLMIDKHTSTSGDVDVGLVVLSTGKLIVDGSTEYTYVTMPRIDLYQAGAAVEMYGNKALFWEKYGNPFVIGIHEYAYVYVQSAEDAVILNTPASVFDAENPVKGYVEYENGADADPSETYLHTSQIVRDAYGVSKGTAVTYYKQSDYDLADRQVAANCQHVGYTARRSEFTVTLQSGMQHVFAFERSGITMPTPHYFDNDTGHADEWTHTCQYCGQKFAHHYEVLNQAHISEVLRYNGAAFYPLAWYCEDCSYSRDLYIATDDTMTVADFNNLSLNRRAEDNNRLIVAIDADPALTLADLDVSADVSVIGGQQGCIVNGKKYRAVLVNFYAWNHDLNQFVQVELEQHAILLPYTPSGSGTYYVDDGSAFAGTGVNLVFEGSGDGMDKAVTISGVTTESELLAALVARGWGFYTGNHATSQSLFGRYPVVRYGDGYYYVHGNVKVGDEETSILVACDVQATEIRDGLITDGTDVILLSGAADMQTTIEELAGYTLIELAVNEDGFVTYKELTPVFLEAHAVNFNDIYGTADYIYDLNGTPYACAPVLLTSADGFVYRERCYVLYPHTVHEYTHAAGGHYCTIGGEYVDHIPHELSEYYLDDYNYNTTYSVIYKRCPSEYCDADPEVYTLKINNLNTSSRNSSTQMSTIRTAVTNANLVVKVDGYRYSVSTRDTSSQRIYAAINTAHTAVSMTGSPVKCLLQVTLTATDGGPALSGTYYIILTA